MNFIKEIMRGDPNQDYIHQRFIRYSRGEFGGPAIALKKTGSNIKISGTADYVNILGELILKNSGENENIKASGNVFSKREIKSELISKSKKRSGRFTSELKGEFSPAELLGIYREFPDATFLLDLGLGNGRFKLKTKKKLPKPGSKPNDKFLSAVLDISLLEGVMGEMCFDVDTQNRNFREIRITHRYLIDEIVIPEEYKNDALKARLFAKRKGMVRRVVDVDGVVGRSEKELIV